MKKVLYCSGAKQSPKTAGVIINPACLTITIKASDMLGTLAPWKYIYSNNDNINFFPITNTATAKKKIHIDDIDIVFAKNRYRDTDTTPNNDKKNLYLEF